MANRTKVKIEGVNHPTVLGYIDNMNANDFEAAVNLFAPNGALQPPSKNQLLVANQFLRTCGKNARGLS